MDFLIRNDILRIAHTPCLFNKHMDRETKTLKVESIYIGIKQFKHVK